MSDPIAIRGATLADAPAVERIVNACTTRDVSLAVHLPGELTRAWEAEPSALEELKVATIGGEVVGYLEIEADGAKRELYFEGYVDPAADGKGVGSVLIEAAEERGRALAREAGAEIEITANLPSHAAPLFETRGYTRVLQEFAMFLDLDRADPPVWPDGVRPAPFVEGRDEDRFTQAMEEFFGTDWPDGVTGGGWIDVHKSDPNYDPGLWWFALRDDEVVGALQGRKQWRAQHDTGWVKNLAVREDARKLGVGRALLLHVAGIFAERGKTRMVLGTDSSNSTRAPEFYKHIGMYVGGDNFDYSKTISG